MPDERFQKIEDEYFLLRGQLETGRINRAQFEAALKEMMFQDAQGHYWMIGADSGKWYLHDGARWIEADPNAASALLPSAKPESPVPSTPVPPQDKPRAPGGRRSLIIVSILAAFVLIGIGVGVGVAINQGFFNVDLASMLGLKPPTRIVVIVPGSTETPLPSSGVTETPLPSSGATGTPLPSPGATGITPTHSSASAVPSSEATLAPQSSPTLLALTATNQPPASPTGDATPLPTNSSTPSYPPGVYVTNLQSDPAQPKRNQGVTFIATFVNSTGAPQNHSWFVEIYDPNNNNKGFGESALQAITVPVGTTVFRSANNWTVTGPGGCVAYYAQAQYRNPDNNRVTFNNTDGSVYSFGFQVCP